MVDVDECGGVVEWSSGRCGEDAVGVDCVCMCVCCGVRSSSLGVEWFQGGWGLVCGNVCRGIGRLHDLSSARCHTKLLGRIVFSRPLIFFTEFSRSPSGNRSRSRITDLRLGNLLENLQTHMRPRPHHASQHTYAQQPVQSTEIEGFRNVTALSSVLSSTLCGLCVRRAHSPATGPPAEFGHPSSR